MITASRSRTVFLTVFIFIAVYFVEAAGFAASSYAVPTRKGLAIELVISADELRGKQLKNEQVLVFDARSEAAYKQGHVLGALLPPALDDKALVKYMERYPKDTQIVTYCTSGGCMAAAVLVLKLRRFGYLNAKDMEDGFELWEEKGYPVAR